MNKEFTDPSVEQAPVQEPVAKSKNEEALNAPSSETKLGDFSAETVLETICSNTNLRLKY